MCRFKVSVYCIQTNTSIVSIHPMCRFKNLQYAKTLQEQSVSIHPMCRFKLKGAGVVLESVSEFQYILCVGSRRAV